MTPHDSFESVLDAASRVAWRIDEVLDGRSRLDFSRPFMPDTLLRQDPEGGLTPGERLRLNQICGHTYLHLFGLIEEFILPFVYDRLPEAAVEDIAKVRALLGFAGEEAKHIDLFLRFRTMFDAGFGASREMVGRPAALASAVLGHSPIGVCLTVLHLEWMTQRHYLECIQGSSAMDPLFKSLLRHHWVEEAQHARVDALLLASMSAAATPDELSCGLEDYFAILHLLDDVLARQAKLDIAALAPGGNVARAEDRTAQVARHHRSLRWIFLGSGMTHPRLLNALETIHPTAAERTRALAAIYS
jgi:hypothetical protein